MAIQSKQGLSTRAQNAMARRLELMEAHARGGRAPTVAQIGATYATMATCPLGYDDGMWGQLLRLAEQAVGVLDICRHCGGRGTISQPIGEGKGFTQKECAVYEQGVKVNHTCHGSGWRRVHNPAPGELPGNMSAEHAQASHKERLTALLERM